MSDTEDFYTAIAAGDLATVRALLDANPELLDEPGPDGESAALNALYHRQGPLADELAARTGELTVFEAAAFDDTERLAQIAERDRTQFVAWSADGWQPLHLAAFFGRAEAARVLLDADAPVTEVSRNATAVQPLHAAVAGRHAELVWLLIASDAPVDEPQPEGWTPLHVAVANGDLDSVRALVAAGANPNRAKNDGVTPLDLAEDEAVRAALNGEQ